jgi:hypothetical protein
MASEWQQNLNLQTYKVNADSYLQMINGIVYGEDPRQGYVDGYTFYHPDLKFKLLSLRMDARKLPASGTYGPGRWKGFNDIFHCTG